MGNADFLRMHVLQDINPATAMHIKLSFVKESNSPFCLVHWSKCLHFLVSHLDGRVMNKSFSGTC